MVTNLRDFLLVVIVVAHACSPALRAVSLNLEVSLGYVVGPCLKDKTEQSKTHTKRLSLAAYF